MKAAQLAKLRRISLWFLMPGLAGLIVSAMVSTYYLETLPKWPAPEEMRMTPRTIHGATVYQTVDEDRWLSLTGYVSVGDFLIGLALGFVYLESWGSRLKRKDEEEDGISENFG